MDQRTSLLTLVDTLTQHEDVTHWAISMRINGKGDFFANLRKSLRGCLTHTAERHFRWFADNWPADLEWPSDIPRPPKSKKEAA